MLCGVCVLYIDPDPGVDKMGSKMATLVVALDDIMTLNLVDRMSSFCRPSSSSRSSRSFLSLSLEP